MKIEKLNKEELLSLQLQIDERLKNLEEVKVIKKEKSKLKNKISDLLRGDKILGIGLSFHDKNVYFTDYCEIRNFGINIEYQNFFNFSVTHGIYPFGCSVCISKEIIKKSYVMIESPNSIYFFTLKPNNWEKDILGALEYSKKNKNDEFVKKTKDLEDNINTIINNKIKIDENIKKNKKNISF